MSARDLRYELIEAFIGAGHAEGFSRETADDFLAQHRAKVLREGAAAIEQAADADEADAIANDGLAYGMSNRAVAIRREDAELLHRMADGSAT